jgi:hypothetical protein
MCENGEERREKLIVGGWQVPRREGRSRTLYINSGDAKFVCYSASPVYHPEETVRCFFGVALELTRISLEE